MADKEELVRVLERHIVPGVRMEGAQVPDGNTKLRSAAGADLSTDRDKFVKVNSPLLCYSLISLTCSVQVSTPAGSAFIVKFDFAGSNGVYHAVDQVF